MTVDLSPDLSNQVEKEVANGGYRGPCELVEQAVREFFYERHRAQRRLDSLRRIGAAVDQHGLYEKVLVPTDE